MPEPGSEARHRSNGSTGSGGDELTSQSPIVQADLDALADLEAARSKKDDDGHAPKVIKKKDPSYLESLKAIAFCSPLNLLLICVPIGLAAGYSHWDDKATFFINFFAIVPLAKLLGFATEEVALRTSETLGGLLNATFGNAVELIIGILALKDNLLRIVQASILGSILSNLLLVMGLCFFVGGLKYPEQNFNKDVASTSASLLTVTTVVFLLPAAFFSELRDAERAIAADEVNAKVVSMSRGAAIVLLVVYACYLFFQLRTHSFMFQDVAKAEIGDDSGEESGESGEEEAQLNVVMSIVLLVVATVLVALCAESLVGSIEGMSKAWGLTESFVGLVLLPIVGNAAEHVTAVTVALKDKMTLSIGVAIGSSLQIALLVAPVLVIVGWIINVPMNLDFSIFEVAVGFVSVFIVNALIADGKSNWLEGALLLGAYIVVCIAFFFLP